MKVQLKSLFLCPVPEEQKPINDYIILKNNYLTVLKRIKKDFVFLTVIFSFFYFFLYFFFDWFLQKKFFLFCLSIILSFSFFFLGRLFSIQNRLNNSRLFYEENSWYNGQTWEKPVLLIKTDRLLSTQKLIKIIKKFKSLSFFSFLLLCFFLFSH